MHEVIQGSGTSNMKGEFQVCEKQNKLPLSKALPWLGRVKACLYTPALLASITPAVQNMSCLMAFCFFFFKK